MATLNWTLEAERWLKDIHAHIAKDSPNTANQVVTAIIIKHNYLKYGCNILFVTNKFFLAIRGRAYTTLCAVQLLQNVGMCELIP